MDAELRIESATPDHRPLLREIAAAGNDAPYDLLTVLDEKCFDPGVWGPSQVLIAYQREEPAGFVVICGRFIRLLTVARGNRGRGVGSALLARAERQIANDGRIRITIGAEAGNYFLPGVAEADRPTLAFLFKRGYVAGDRTSNLECALEDNTLISSAEGKDVRRLKEGDRPALTRFIEENFGRIWAFETQAAVRNQPPTIFLAEAEGAIVGFSAHDSNNRGLGFFGPTGVQQSHRGKGLGRALLLASLRDLRELHYARAIIPWTDAIDFYRRSCGAEVRHTFVSCSKNL